MVLPKTMVFHGFYPKTMVFHSTVVSTGLNRRNLKLLYRFYSCNLLIFHHAKCQVLSAQASWPAARHRPSFRARATMNADIEGRLRDAHLNTEFWRERLQSRRARRAAPFMVARVGRRSGAAPQICDRVSRVRSSGYSVSHRAAGQLA